MRRRDPGRALPASQRPGEKSHLGAHLGQDAPVGFVKTDLHQDGRLAPVCGWHDHVDRAAETVVRKRIQLDLARLAGSDLFNVGFGHVHLGLQRPHVGKGHHGCLGIGGSRERRHDIPHIGVLGKHDRIERRPDHSEFLCHAGSVKCCRSRSDTCLRAGYGRFRFAVAGFSRIVVRPGDDALRQQCLHPAVGKSGIVQFRPGLFQHGS